MSETKNGRLGLYGARQSKCNGMMTLGFKGLMSVMQFRVSGVNAVKRWLMFVV